MSNTPSSSSLLLDIEQNLNKKQKTTETESLNTIGKPSFLQLPQQDGVAKDDLPRFAPSELLARLQNFLPQIREANEKLENNEFGIFSDCVEIVENDEDEYEEQTEENYEEESEHKPYVEMNVVLGVLEQKQKTSLITDLDGPTEYEQKLEDKEDAVNLRIGKDFTPQENKNIEQDMVAYMNIMNSLLGSSSALKRKRSEEKNDNSSDSDSD